MKDMTAAITIRLAIGRKKTMPVDVIINTLGKYRERAKFPTLERTIEREGIKIYSNQSHTCPKSLNAVPLAIHEGGSRDETFPKEPKSAEGDLQWFGADGDILSIPSLHVWYARDVWYARPRVWAALLHGKSPFQGIGKIQKDRKPDSGNRHLDQGCDSLLGLYDRL